MKKFVKYTHTYERHTYRIYPQTDTCVIIGCIRRDSQEKSGFLKRGTITGMRFISHCIPFLYIFTITSFFIIYAMLISKYKQSYHKVFL